MSANILQAKARFKHGKYSERGGGVSFIKFIEMAQQRTNWQNLTSLLNWLPNQANFLTENLFV